MKTVVCCNGAAGPGGGVSRQGIFLKIHNLNFFRRFPTIKIREVFDKWKLYSLVNQFILYGLCMNSLAEFRDLIG